MQKSNASSTRTTGPARLAGARGLTRLAGSAVPFGAGSSNAPASVPGTRHGSVLVLVIGVLALLAIVIVVYTTIGQADVRAGRTVVTKTAADEQARAVGRYIAQIIGDDATKTFNESDVATGVTRVVRQPWDYPSTDPALLSARPGVGGVPGGTIPDAEWRARRFNPVGASRHAWVAVGQLSPDPRTPSDPWLASTEPVWLNSAGRLLTDAQTPNLALWHNDWLNLSLIAPDGRPVNLANLRGNFFAEPGFGLDANGLPRTSANLARLARAGGGTGATPSFQWDTSITSTSADYNRPATWSANQVGLAVPRALGSSEPAGSPRFLDNMFADADGDGMYDSRWQELIDASDQARPLNLMPGVDNMRFFVAPRVIDLSGLVNVNTATSFTDPFGLLHDDGPGDQQPGDLALYDPLLPIGLTSTGAQVPNGALRAAPIRYRYTLSIDPTLNSTGVDRQEGQALNRGLVGDSPVGVTPADIDLERVLTSFDAFRYFGRPALDHFGPDGASFDQFNDLGQLQRDEAVTRMMVAGGASFSGLITARELGVASLNSIADFTGQTPTDFMQAGRLTFPIGAGAESTAEAVTDPANVSSYRHKLFVTARDRQEIYRLAAPGGARAGTRQSLTQDNWFGPDGNPRPPGVPNASASDVIPVTFSGTFGGTDELELRTFMGVNDPTTQSRLEVAGDGRSLEAATRGWGSVGPLRSRRSLLADRDAVDAPDAAASRTIQSVTDVRRLLTTVSGARPLGSVYRRYFPAQVNDNAQPVPEFGITAGEVKLDVAVAVERAIGGDRASLNALFNAYAETFLPLASLQFDDEAYRNGTGYNLWAESNAAISQRRRTSVTQFGGGLLRDEAAGADVERLIPASNSELALRTAAHMAVNIMAWRDATGTTPIAATLLLNEDERRFVPGGNGAGPLGRLAAGVPVYPFWPTTALNEPGATVRSFALDFSRETDTQDLDRDSNRTERVERLNRDDNAPLTRARAVNIFAIQPQPVITHVSSFVLYSDAPQTAGAQDGELYEVTVTSPAPTLAAFNDFVRNQTEAAEQLVESEGNEFEYFRLRVRSSRGFPEQTRTGPGRVKISGQVEEANKDFLMEVVAIQLTNPFDVPIPLSGQLNAAQALATQNTNAPRAAGDPLRVEDGTTSITDDNFSYYFEFAGRFYRPVRYLDNAVTDARAARESALVLGPRETIVFYIPGQDLDDIATRWNAVNSGSGGGVGGATSDVRTWINTQMGTRIFDAQNRLVRIVAPVRLLPFNPSTGAEVIPDATDGLGVLWPQSPAYATGGASPTVPAWMVPGDEGNLANRTVRLWKAIRADVRPASGTPFEEVVTVQNAASPPNNRIENDQLVDVLRDSNIRQGTLGSLDRRLNASITGLDRMGRRTLVQATESQPGGAGDNTGYSILLTGGFRRPDDPRGGPAPDDQAAASFPRGAMPAWVVEAKPGLFSASASLSSMPLALRSRNTTRELVKPNAAWALDSVASGGGPQVYGFRTLSKADFIGSNESAGSTGLQSQHKAVFMTLQFGGVQSGLRDIGAEPLFNGDNFSDFNGLRFLVVGQVAKDSIRESAQWQLTRHPAVKGVTQPIANQDIPGGPDDTPADDTNAQAVERRATWIDRSHLDRPTAFTNQGANSTAFRPATNQANELEGTLSGQVYDALYAQLPLAPRPVVQPANAVPTPLQERPELPDMRAGDVLMPWAIGPSWAPGGAEGLTGTPTRNDILDAQWTTLGEAMALALDYGAPARRSGTTSVLDVDSPYFRAGLVLDRCRLKLDTPVPFNDADEEGRFPGRDQTTEAVRPLGSGIPLAMALLDRMRAGSPGDRTQAAPGVVNINTAPLAVLRVLPMVTAFDAVEQGTNAIRGFAVRSWMTWGPQRSISAIEPYRDGPFSSTAGDLPAKASLNADELLTLERTRLRNRQETIWDVASTIAAYRDKNAVHTMPSQDGTERFIADFAEGNDTTYSRPGPEAFRDNARRALTGIPGLREQRGFQSVGELLAVKLRDQFAVNPQNPSSTTLIENYTPRNQHPDVTNLPGGFDRTLDLTTEAQLSINRFARDFQPADYTMNKASAINTPDPAVRPDFQIPLALSSFATPRALEPEIANATRSISDTAPTTAAVVPYQRESFANLRPGSVSDEYEEQMLIANALLNNVSVRSDVFAVYFVLHGYRPSDVEGLTRDVTDPAGSFGAPMVPTLNRRFVMVVDRSGVTEPGDQPRILLFDELPAN
jgi:hypothetical protein